MRKIDKKLENQIRDALIDACDQALQQIDGFQWLTHLVDFKSFPQSLKIICVFEQTEQITTLKQKHLQTIIIKSLDSTSIKVKLKQIYFDSEEHCLKTHNGNWQKYFAKFYGR